MSFKNFHFKLKRLVIMVIYTLNINRLATELEIQIIFENIYDLPVYENL